jgi:hypothetical protein
MIALTALAILSATATVVGAVISVVRWVYRRGQAAEEERARAEAVERQLAETRAELAQTRSELAAVQKRRRT